MTKEGSPFCFNIMSCFLFNVLVNPFWILLNEGSATWRNRFYPMVLSFRPCFCCCPMRDGCCHRIYRRYYWNGCHYTIFRTSRCCGCWNILSICCCRCFCCSFRPCLYERPTYRGKSRRFVFYLLICSPTTVWNNRVWAWYIYLPSEFCRSWFHFHYPNSPAWNSHRWNGFCRNWYYYPNNGWMCLREHRYNRGGWTAYRIDWNCRHCFRYKVCHPAYSYSQCPYAMGAWAYNRHCCEGCKYCLLYRYRGNLRRYWRHCHYKRPYRRNEDRCKFHFHHYRSYRWYPYNSSCLHNLLLGNSHYNHSHRNNCCTKNGNNSPKANNGYSRKIRYDKDDTNYCNGCDNSNDSTYSNYDRVCPIPNLYK